MMNQVLWTLDNETHAKTFERLCVDLLYRNGYKKIIPIGGMHDRGRDAEASGLSGTDTTGELIFFQFSQQKDWIPKLRSEFRKIRDNGHKIAKLVFVTSQDVSGRHRDQMRDEAREEYGWDLLIFSREWLRLQLEEAHPDIAYRHLKIQPLSLSRLFAGSFEFSRPEVEDLQRAWTFFAQGDFDRAASDLRDYLDRNVASSEPWEMFAWCLYATFRYDEALSAINKALELSPVSVQARSIRGCILAERGIDRGDKESIRQANNIFCELLLVRDDGLVHYNYGNTLSALSRHGEAVRHYRMAIEREPADPRIWKNLATAYHEIGQHEEEMLCFDRALDLDPDLPQALVSKGVSLMMDFEKPHEAIEFIERGIQSSRGLALRFSPAWYWLGEAYRRIGDLSKGLESIRQGLLQFPGDVHLRKLEFDVLSDLWRNGGPTEESLRCFLSVVADEPRHYAARVEAAELLEQTGHMSDAWNLLEEVWSAVDQQVQTRLRDLGFSLDDCCQALNNLPIYIWHRRRYPVSDYHHEEFLAYQNKRWAESLFVSGAITFGLAKGALAHILTHSDSEESERKRLIVGVCMSMLENIERCVALASGELAFGLSDDPETISEKITAIIVFAPRVAGEEWMRQYGWLLAAFEEIDNSAQEGIISAFTGRDVFSSMVEPVLREINRIASIFPEETDASSPMEAAPQMS